MKIKLMLAAVLAAAMAPASRAEEKDCVTVAVFSINDFHGAFMQDLRKGIPGAAAVWQTLDSLKAAYPLHLTVAAGDNFGGSYFATATDGALMPVLFNDLGIRLSAMGNHEFDNGTAWLADKWKNDPLRPSGWDICYVCANVRDSSGHTPSYMQPCATEDIVLPSGKRIKVGFVGLLASSTPLQTRKKNIAGLSFSGDYAAVLRQLRSAPEYADVARADVRLLLTHVGTKTASGSPAWDDADSANIAAFSDPDFHGILSAHSHKPVCGRINDGRYPVVQGEWHGNYVSILKCRIDTASMTVRSVEPELCRVNPHIPLGEGPKRFNAQIDSLLRVTKTPGGVPLGERLTASESVLFHDRNDKYQLTEVGGLVCAAYADAYRKAAHAGNDAVIVGASHFGSIRAGFPKGDISVLDVGEALPFSNALKCYRLTGAQLKALVDFGLHNRKYGWLQTNSLTIFLDKAGNVSRLAYATPDGKNVALDDEKSCILVADEFITTGGDGYAPASFPEAQAVNDVRLPATTDAFINYLKSLPSIGNATRHASLLTDDGKN